MHLNSQNLIKSETVVQKVLLAGFQTVIKLESGVCMITASWYPLSATFGNRRVHKNPNLASTLRYI